MRVTSLLLGVIGPSLLVFSCGGSEFGTGTANSGAGETSTDGGSPAGDGGSSMMPPQGGRSGSTALGGTVGSAGEPVTLGGDSSGGNASGGNGSGGSPDECSDVVIGPDKPGDCQQVVCSMGMLVSQADPDDAPTPRGACDFPVCENGKPVFHADPSKCKLNEACTNGQCKCAGCPNGTVAGLQETACRLPANVVVTADKTLMGSAAGNVADGSAMTQWNSGAPDGVLTIKPQTPQAMNAIIVWLVGSAANDVPVDQKYISVNVSVETDNGGPIVSKGAQFSFAQASTGSVRLDVGLLKAKKITLTFYSPSSWIASHEVIFEVCP